jgi:hypothetical protein
VVQLENIHLEHSLPTRYTADLRLVNQGAATGRDVAVVFADLPQGVELVNASGVDAAGSPLLNLHEAIPSGGLASGARSRAVTVHFHMPDLTRFPLASQVYTAGPNHAPLLESVGPLSLLPGAPLEIALAATDQDDGDTITFSIRPMGLLPQVAIRNNQTLVVAASPAELGAYTFELVASDGAAEAVEAVSLEVVADEVTTTRVSGRVLDTDSQGVAGVPVQVGEFLTTTAPDGRFTLEFPAGKVPTAAMNIAIPPGDPYFDPLATGAQTMPFRRAVSDPATGDSASNPLRHPNLVSSFIDASAVYGSDAHRAAALRTGDGSGRLKTTADNLLPQNNSLYFPNGPLENDNAGPFDPGTLFVAGDVRASENPGLASLHTLLVREHNRKADELAAAQPAWTGDQIYEAARRWVGALVQHITYAEYLPMLLGPGAIGAYTQYDATVDPGMSGLFSTAAYRLGHSIVAPEFLLLDDAGSPLPGGPLALREVFFNPQPILDAGIEPVLRGLAVQPAQELDAHVIDDLRNFLFGPPGAGGLDLVSVNMQRGRDLGLPSYNQTRIELGLEPVEEFAQITSDPDLQAALQAVYGDVDQIDVWAGGLAEDHLPGAMLGELFWTVVRDQFLRFRDGDRFWYENAQFTAAELAEIRATTLADIIQRNTSISAIAPFVFTSGPVPTAPPAGGMPAAVTPGEVRSFDGGGNNPLEPSLGQAGTNLVLNYTPAYADGVSTPAGDQRPPVREISNAVFAQGESIPSTEHATYMLVMWGQLIDHDVGLTPAGITDVMTVLGADINGGNDWGNLQQTLPASLGHTVYAGYNNVIASPLILPVAGSG